MTRTFLGGLFLVGLLIAAGAASLQSAPGYMDADYYYAGALRIAGGQGATEPYLWNYLNDPEALPAPSFAYWMPLTSLIGAAGILVTGAWGFWGARLGLILLAALVPVVTSLLSYQMTCKGSYARWAGVLALFPGFYIAQMTTTDAFSIYMVLGCLFLMTAGAASSPVKRLSALLLLFALGILAGLLHMTRADGLLWLGGAGLAVVMTASREGFFARQSRSPGWWLRLPVSGAAVLAGYLLITSLWYLRNIQEWHALFPPGGSRAIWITTYEETMLFPASLLNPDLWLSAGWAVHLQAWWNALLINLQTIVAVQGGIILLPFIITGLWRLRDRVEVRLGACLWLLTVLVMTSVFPLAGQNGSFYHSGAAFQPLFWAAAPLGIASAAGWYARKRALPSPERLSRFLSIVVLVIGALLSGFIYVQRVVGVTPGQPLWNASSRHYELVERALVQHGAEAGEAVLVNNPPEYWIVSGRPAAVIPYGDVQMLVAAARKYHVKYLVLELTNPWQLRDLYETRIQPPELEYLDSVDTTRLYRIRLDGD